MNCNSFRPSGFQTQGNFPFGWINLQMKVTVYWLSPAWYFFNLALSGPLAATRHVNRDRPDGGGPCKPCIVLSTIQKQTKNNNVLLYYPMINKVFKFLYFVFKGYLCLTGLLISINYSTATLLSRVRYRISTYWYLKINHALFE